MSRVTAEIADVAYGGDGVARCDGKVIFVPGTIAGETVEMEIVSDAKRFSRAVPVKILTPSSDRIENDCPYSFNTQTGTAPCCAGCCYRHMTYDAELSVKKKQLQDLLSRIAKLESIPGIAAHAAPNHSRYRNKVVLHAAPGGKLGYYSTDNNTIIDTPDCLLADTDISNAIAGYRANMTKTDGDVTFRSSEADDVKVWDSPVPSSPPMTFATAAGPLKAPPSGFSQINPEVSTILTDHLKSLISEISPSALVDIYCGAGIFSISAVQAGVADVFGIEIDQPSVDCATENAKTLVPGHANFICSDALRGFKTVRGALKDLREAVVLVDPPRKGLDPHLLNEIARTRLKKLVYIACAPDKLARDLKAIISKGGYSLDSLDLFDMFPRTASFETVAVLNQTA